MTSDTAGLRRGKAGLGNRKAWERPVDGLGFELSAAHFAHQAEESTR